MNADWKLIKRLPSGEESVIAERVVHFDLCPDGIVWTNGSRIYLIDASGKQSELARGKLIEHIAVIQSIQNAQAATPTDAGSVTGA